MIQIINDNVQTAAGIRMFSSRVGKWGQVLIARGWRMHGPNQSLEGLPVDGTCSVFFIFPLRHPHLFKGVQRGQDGATAKRERMQSQQCEGCKCQLEPAEQHRTSESASLYQGLIFLF